MKEFKGLSVDVYRSTYYGKSEQVTNNHNTLLLVGEGVEGPFTETDPSKVVVLVKRFLFGRDYYHVQPVEPMPGMVGPMFGGNYVKTCDSRFPHDYPLPVHDRYEIQTEYEHLIR